MNAQRWEEIQASFDQLVELDASERAGRLATLASTDPELHQALESLLEADAAASAQLAPIDTAFLPQSDYQPDPLGLTGRTISHFDLREALGAGGMGVVYRADDTRLGRVVALKFLLPHYSLDASAKARFLREAHAAAALDHPNLCTVYEIGTSDEGWLFLAMALYQGETLRARLTRDGPILVREALEIARQIAEGLQAAHAAGIVHRDLKPGNVMLLPDGAVRILDFGLAKARDQSVSETGARFGTVSYMSPEQVRGENVDGRADLWALGIVLYEMLTGRKPFGGDEEVAIAHAILHDEPELPSTHRGDLSAALEGVVLRLLQKNPGKRHAAAADVLRDLARTRTLADGTTGLLRTRSRRVRRRLTGALRPAKGRLLFGITGLAVLAAGYLGLHSVRDPTNRGAVASADSPRSIAILPFANVGGDSTNEPFSDGIADELTTALGKLPQLSVMARTSAFSLKRKGLDAREIGRQLRVQYVLEGSVRRAVNRWRVRADLIDVPSGKEVWSDAFENDALNRDVFAVEDSITRSIVRKVLPRISSMTMASLVKRPTEKSTTAHDLYLQGRYFRIQRTQSGLRTAARYFERAIAQDSSYAEAFAALAWTYSNFGAFEVSSPREAYPKAKAAAVRALELDSTLAEAHLALGNLLRYQWNWAGAEREFRRAIELNPSDASTYQLYGQSLSWLGRQPEALAVIDHAVALDPLSRIINVVKGNVLYRSRRNDEAIVQLRRTLELDPDFVYTHMNLGQAYLAKGMHSEAVAELETAARPPGPGYVQGILAHAYAVSGRRDLALAIVQNLTQRARHAYVSPVDFAYAYVGLGETDRAVAELDKAAEAHDSLLIFALTDPVFDPLQSDPRFTALRRKAGLPCGPSC